jgi:hypothetical protein
MFHKRSIKKHITDNCVSYVPVYPEKYRGKPPIICRSGWEEAFCRWADHSHGVVRWSSEEIVVRYQDPIDPILNGKPHLKQYWPDYIIETEKGEIFLIEVKPYKETIPPKQSGAKSRKTVLTENKTWLVNQAKWRSARNYCAQKGWVFKIITEKELFGK